MRKDVLKRWDIGCRNGAYGVNRPVTKLQQPDRQARMALPKSFRKHIKDNQMACLENMKSHCVDIVADHNITGHAFKRKFETRARINW